MSVENCMLLVDRIRFVFCALNFFVAIEAVRSVKKTDLVWMETGFVSLDGLAHNF